MGIKPILMWQDYYTQIFKNQKVYTTSSKHPFNLYCDITKLVEFYDIFINSR